MKKKLFDIPITDILEVRLGEGILNVSAPGNTIQNATIDSWEDEL